MDIGKTIRKKRRALDITQSSLAEKLGVSNQTVWNWEKNIVCPDGKRLLKVMATLGLEREDMVKEEAATPITIAKYK